MTGGSGGTTAGPRGWDLVAAALVRLRWAVVLGWTAVAVAATVWLPPLTETDGDVQGFTSGANPAVAVEQRSFELFGVPLSSRTSIVQRDPDGLSVYAQAEAVLRAAALSTGRYESRLLGALPVPNTFAAFPGSAESGTTVVTYVFTDPETSFGSQRRAAEDFAREHLGDPDDAFVGVTGSVPARNAQYHLIQDNLHVVELVTVLAVALIVGLTFRSVVAPVLTLLVVAAAVAVTLGVGGALGRLLGVSVPPDLRPLIVALLLGVVTDYCILYLSGLRHRLTLDATSRGAARTATRQSAPIVAVAGVTVAAGTGALVIARSPLFSGAGPALALTVVMGLVVSLTLVPAAMAITGRWTFWPSRPAAVEPGDDLPQPSRITRLVTQRRSAAVTAAVSVVVLCLAAAPLVSLRLGLGFIQSLPEDERVARAAAQAQAGFAAGILSPTELLLEGPAVGTQVEALQRLATALDRQPGVAGVLAPGDLPPLLAEQELGVDLLTTADGAAARVLIVFDSSPLGAQATADLRDLRRRLPGLLTAAGLPGVTGDFAGDTALSEAVVDATSDDLLRITVTALGVNLLMLLVFLRALVAPVYLLACSVLALCASLGLTTLLFQGLLGHDGLTFYVPFTAAVLLVSLGSDYNIFAVGHIWQVAERHPLRQALLIAIPQSTGAIVAAGLALAASFGLLALVPLDAFRELAFAMSVGILLDVFVVRALLVPSLMTLVGRVSGWPSSRLDGPSQPAEDAGPPDSGAQALSARAGRPAARGTPAHRGPS